MMDTVYEGIIAPITTPFERKGEIATTALEENLEKYSASPLSGVLVGGTTGEGSHLSSREKVELARRARSVVPSRKKFMVGVSSASLRGALSFVDQLSEIELDALLVSVPSYYKSKMNDEAIAHYFEELASHSPFPILLYNIPKFTGIELNPSLVARLADHPKIAGMKESSGNMIYLQKILHAVSEKEFQVISGSAETFVLAHSLGVRAGILAISCVVPDFVVKVFETCESRGSDLASKQHILFELSSTIVGRLSVPGVKYAMDFQGMNGRYSRAPLMPLTAQEEEEVETVLKLGSEFRI